jgi:RHS repeat-associated protein
LGGILGVIGAPQKIIDTAFAALTAPLAALFPSLPAVTLLGMHIGPPHAHTHPPSLIPPAPPVPLPSIGCLVGAGSVTVLVGGMPAARAGDIGISVTCGSLAPPFEVYTGSSNVFIGGARAARTLDLTKHCNPTAMGPFAIAMGVAGVVAAGAGAVASGSGYAAAQAGADAAVLALKLLCGKDPGIPPGMGVLVGPPVPNVLIGGFPCPPVGQMAWGEILKALGQIAGAVGGRSSQEDNGCCGNGGEPIYVVTGENFNRFVDFISGGLFEWRRHYTSARHRTDSPLGYGWRHFYQRTLSVRLNRATFTDWDGLQTQFPRFERGSDTTRSKGYVLRRLSRGHYRLSYRSRPVMEFEGDQFVGGLQLRRLVTNERELDLQYDGLGRLANAVDRSQRAHEERRFTFRYDPQGHLDRVFEVLSPSGPSNTTETALRVAYRYAAAGDLLEARDALSGVWLYDYDAFHRMTRQEDARRYAFTYKYDAFGRCIEASGQDGLWATTLEYFPDKRYTRCEEGGAVWEYHYDSDGVITKVIDPYGGVRQRERDDEGKLVLEIDSGGRELRWAYDAEGAHTARVDRFGNVFPPELEVPVLPNPFARTLPNTSLGFLFEGAIKLSPLTASGLEPSTLYAVPQHFQSQALLCFRVGPPSRGLFPLPQTRGHSIERDALGRKIREIDSLGRSEQWDYDETGNVIRHRDRDGHASTQTTVSWNLVGTQSNPLGLGVRYEYSALEQITGIEDSLGNKSSYRYDLKGRLIEVRRNGRLREQYVYDKGDHFIEKRNGQGAVLFRNEIHDNHLVARRELASGGFHRFDYDPRGRVVEASTKHHDVRLAFAANGALARDVHDGAGIEHQKDGPAWITRVFDKFALGSTWRSAHAELIDPGGGKTSLDHDGRGGITRRCSNGTVEVLQYDIDGRLVAQLSYRNDYRGRSGSRCVAYTYTAEGDLVRVIDSVRGTTVYEVDSAHRLAREVTPQQNRYEFGQDTADNLHWSPGAGAPMQLGEGNRLTAVSGETFDYNDRDHVATRHAADGRVTKYVYDSFDMLVRIERVQPNGSAGPLWEATYDAIGRRITTNCGELRREFYWQGDRLAAEVFPDGHLRIYQYATSRALVPIAFTDFDNRESERSSGRSYQVFSNPVGMPTCIENDRGEVVWWAKRIDPFGTVELRADSRIECNLRWPGHYYDPETELHYNRYRYYDPKLGRYLQSDPIGYAGSPRNLYAYVANPLVSVDLLGLHPEKSGTTSTEAGENEGREAPTTPPHSDTELDNMTPEQMQDLCKFHADALAELQEPRPERQNMNTFSVGVLEDEDGNRRLVATSNLDDGPNRAASNYMDQNGISNESDAPPHLTRAPVTDESGNPVVDQDGTPKRQTIDADTGEPYDKKTQSEHHAEQRMETVAGDNGETVLAQCPSQGCCSGCQSALSQPDANGQRPIDNIPPDRQTR